MEKVYCKNCKYFGWEENCMFRKVKPNWHSPNSTQLLHEHCEVHNEDNDCEDFTERSQSSKFWEKICFPSARDE